MAYADLQKLRRSEISTGIDGGKWIFTRRQKTDSPSGIPVLPMAMTILEKYANHPQCQIQDKVLPILSNQKMNAYLKEIADCCGISNRLTFHIARHTFATTITLSNGVPIETVSKMLGHRNLKTTQHYAKILDKKVSQDMQALKEKLSAKPFFPAAKSNHKNYFSFLWHVLKVLNVNSLRSKSKMSGLKNPQMSKLNGFIELEKRNDQKEMKPDYEIIRVQTCGIKETKPIRS